jgi:voltage-gated potassium channel
MENKDFENRILTRVALSLWLIITLIAIVTFILTSQGIDTRYAIYKSTSMISQIYVEDYGISTMIVYLLAFMGKVLVIYIIYILIVLFNEGLLFKSISEGKRMRKISRLKNHYIVCGGGRVGSNVALELQKVGVPFVIIEKDIEMTKSLHGLKMLAIDGDSMDEHTLDHAGIKDAKVLVSCLDNDGDNILQIITAKRMNPHLRIVARANYTKFIDNLKKAGADSIVMPEVIGGIKIAEAALKV